MSNEGTRKQIERWLLKTYERSKNPNSRQRIKNKRKGQKVKVAKKFGL